MSVEPIPFHLLQAEGPAELLSRIDELRNLGFRHRICLPQLVICGLKGCGKTSVFSAVTGISLPVGHDIHTRFPVEVVFRKAPDVSTHVKIRPGPNASSDHKQNLQSFSSPEDWLDDVFELFSEVESLVGIDDNRRYSDDVLQLELAGPSFPDLTVVDLPGVLHEPNDDATAEEASLIAEITETYTSNPRSIVLAVVSADVPLSHHSLLQLLGNCASRTMGIITKPDTIDSDSVDLNSTYSRVKYQDSSLKLGWHVLKDIDTTQRDVLDRDESETLFFSTRAPWKALSPNSTGSESLRDRINKVLLGQVELQLSILSSEIQEELETQRSLLVKLGPDMSSPTESRQYITRIGATVQRLTRDASSGDYSDPFFRHSQPVRRLRSIVRKWAEDFSSNMRQRGHNYVIYDDAVSVVLQAQIFPDDPQPVAKADYIQEVVPLLQSQGSAQVIGELFIRQSAKWDRITKAHISEVWKKVKGFLDDLLHHTAGIGTCKAIIREVISREMEDRLQKTLAKVDELLIPYRRITPLTLDRQVGPKLRHIRRKSSPGSDHGNTSDIDDNSLYDDILDCAHSYYFVALNVFLDNVAGLAVENCLLDGLEDILSPNVISRMADEEIGRLAANSQEIKSLRLSTARKVKVFEVTAAACTRCQMAALESSARNFSTVSDDSSPSSPALGSDMSSRKASSASSVDFFDDLPVREKPSTNAKSRVSSPPQKLLVFPATPRTRGLPSHSPENDFSLSPKSDTSSRTGSSSNVSDSQFTPWVPPSLPKQITGRRSYRVDKRPSQIPSPELSPTSNCSSIYSMHTRAVSADKVFHSSRQMLGSGFFFEQSGHNRTLSAERVMSPVPEASVPSGQPSPNPSVEKIAALPSPPPRSPARALSLMLRGGGNQPVRRRLSKMRPETVVEEKSFPSISMPFNFHHHGAVPEPTEPMESPAMI